MKYERHTVALPNGDEQEYITVYLDENNAKTFPADENNADYVAFLAEQETAK